MHLAELTPRDVITNNDGSLYVVVGGMKGFKSAMTINFYKTLAIGGIPHQVFKPRCDYRRELHERYSIPQNYVASRTGLSHPAIELDDKGDFSDLDRLIDLKSRVFGFPEFHLYNQAGELVERVKELVRVHKKIVVVDVLDRDFRGETIPAAAELMAHAFKVDKTYGVCDVEDCNGIGEYSQRIIDGKPAKWDDPFKLVGASEAYEARCANHHEVLNKPKRRLFFHPQTK